jgi:hypothetical protein
MVGDNCKGCKSKQMLLAGMLFSAMFILAIMASSQSSTAQAHTSDQIPTSKMQGILLPEYEPNSLNFYRSPGNICSRVESLDPTVRDTAVSIAKNNTGKWNVAQLVDMFVWMKKNVAYVNDPEGRDYYAYASETLEVGGGDCDDQAILATSMIEAIGGSSQIVVGKECSHAYSTVYIGNSTEHYEEITEKIKEIYSKKYKTKIEGNFTSYTDSKGGIWLVFDPTGGVYLGDVLPACRDVKPNLKC